MNFLRFTALRGQRQNLFSQTRFQHPLITFPLRAHRIHTTMSSQTPVFTGSTNIGPNLRSWILSKQSLLQADNIHICTGSDSENNQIIASLVERGIMIPLNASKRPNSYLTRTHPGDVARSEGSTYICSERKEDAGPTNNWVEPGVMREKLNGLFKGCMKGRTMYVIPFSMGPVNSPLSRIGIEITDSPFVVANMRIMTRIGDSVLKALNDGPFVPCIHSVGAPLLPGQKDSSWPCNLANRHIVHFPSTKEIWSFGSGYGGNSLLGKKCFALRIASVMAREDKCSLAEHMLILGLTSPKGKKYYVAAAFPSACGKTNLAMLEPAIPGWKVECVGDDIAWMKINPSDGRLYAINPENGFFGVAPGTSLKTNPQAIATISKNTIFTNVALTEDGDVWWEGLTKSPPSGKLTSWENVVYDPSDPSSVKPTNFAHPNSRFTAPTTQCPIIDPKWEDIGGVPISAIIFGGRRERLVPLVFEARSWEHGVLVGSSVASEKTAAAEGKVGEVRFDPFAMLPFCGYNMGDYFSHWLQLRSQSPHPENMPKIFHVNWFRKSSTGEFLWPGFGDNARVLEWIIKRLESPDETKVVDTAIGFIPRVEDLNTTGLGVSKETLEELLRVDSKGYLEEVGRIEKYHEMFGERYPEVLRRELAALRERLGRGG